VDIGIMAKISWAAMPLLIVIIQIPAAGGTSAVDRCRLLVGENRRVSDVGALRTAASYMEPVVDVSPRNPNHLAVAAIEVTTAYNRVRAFISTNGGRSWTREDVDQSKLPADSVDPAVLYTADGSIMVQAVSAESLDHLFNRVLISADAGHSWTMGLLPISFMDKPSLVQDKTNGRFSGNIYIYGLSASFIGDAGIWRLNVARSEDGVDWHGTEIINSDTLRTKLGEPPSNLLIQRSGEVLINSSGTVFVPYYSRAQSSNTQGEPPKDPLFWVSKSTNGGRTFGDPTPMLKADGTPLMTGTGPIVSQAYAVNSSMGRFSDDLYVVWQERSPNQKQDAEVRVLFSRSTDSGATWGPPTLLDTLPYEADTAVEFPAISVNKRGVVLVSWYRIGRLGHSGGMSYQRFVTASTNGGADFSPRCQWLHVRLCGLICRTDCGAGVTHLATTSIW
jgi:hypothetical protein